MYIKKNQIMTFCNIGHLEWISRLLTIANGLGISAKTLTLAKKQSCRRLLLR
jgi:hypothetical protein